MQTFILDHDIVRSAQLLDQKRLGQQRNEAIQIASILTGLTPYSRWKFHPAVKMWKGYESFLVWKYISIHLSEWARRGHSNKKNLVKLAVLLSVTRPFLPVVKPHWLTDSFIESHRSNMIRKKPEFYKELFPETIEGLAYIWPTKEL